MKLHLKHRFYHLLWNLSTKRRITVNDQEIVYIGIPHWLLFRGFREREFFSDGMCLTYRKKKKLMVFISNRKIAGNLNELRYTAYHEHLEGTHFLGGVCENQKQEFVNAVEFLGKDKDERIRKIFAKAEKRTNQKGHFFALILELALAKKEMHKDDFSKFLSHAANNRI